MDSFDETQSNQKPDALAAAASPDVRTGRAADSKEGATSIPPIEAKASDVDVKAREAKEVKDDKQGAEKPKANDASEVLPPVPSSALVVLPPSMRRFDPKDDAAAGSKARSASWAKWLRNGSRAALVLVLFGCAFAAGRHFLGSTPFAQHAAASAAPAAVQVAQTGDESAEMRRATKALGDQIHSLETRLESLRVAAQTQTPEEIRGLKKSIDGLKASLDAEKAESSASIAQLSAKLDKLQREEAGKVTQASLEKSERSESKPVATEKVERVDSKPAQTAATEKTERIDPKAIQATLDKASRGEKTSGAPLTTASIPATSASPQAAVGSSKAQPLPLAEAQKKPPQLLTNWVVRDVYDGIALVEGPEGAIEVMTGETIPGAGTVKSIERKGNGWIVVTSRGIVDYVHD